LTGDWLFVEKCPGVLLTTVERRAIEQGTEYFKNYWENKK